MDQPMTKEESYAERRQLFKNIWDTSLAIDDKDAEIMNKPKVIKTLRLSEVDRCIVDKKKKQRIKNLRTVCRKILDFCDRQDADDLFYEKIAADGQKRYQHKMEEKPKKVKPVRTIKKLKRTKSSFAPLHEPAHGKATVSERKHKLLNKTLKNTSPTKIKRTTLVKKSNETSKGVISKRSPRNIVRTSEPGNPLTDLEKIFHSGCKVVKKKHSRRKKASGSALPLGAPIKYKYKIVTPGLGHSTALNHAKKILQIHKTSIN